MNVETAKRILEDEVKDANTNISEPLTQKWPTWKIIDYLWSCYIENEDKYDQKEWLINLYKEAGMQETSIEKFEHEIDLLMECIEEDYPMSA